MKLLIVVPTFNESAVIKNVLKSLPQKLKGFSEVNKVVIDDGSTDSTFKIVQKTGVHVIKHSLNRGLGAAIRTGMEVAKKYRADVMVTFDGDGQHKSSDIPKIVDSLLAGKADLIIGSRFQKFQKVPMDRLILNWAANFATFFLYGVLVSDSQSGLRAFSKKAINMIELRADRMDFSSEILLEAKRNKLKIKEIPIKAVYNEYSRTKGQKNTNALPIFARFLVRLLR